MSLETLPYVTPAEYLAFEREAERKHEYDDGEIVEMPGGTKAHSLIKVNLLDHFRDILPRENCTRYDSDMSVRVPRCNRYFYPDMSVVYGASRFEDEKEDTLLNPTLVVEVMSPSSEERDRVTKQQCYKTLESLQVYLIVLQDTPQIEVYQRDVVGEWKTFRVTGRDANLILTRPAVTISLTELYRKIEFEGDA